jgi:hypothetical protein
MAFLIPSAPRVSVPYSSLDKAQNTFKLTCAQIPHWLRKRSVKPFNDSTWLHTRARRTYATLTKGIYNVQKPVWMWHVVELLDAEHVR